MKQSKITFYPKSEAVDVLKAAPSKKISERVNELIIKGLAKEKEEEIERQYERFNLQVSNSPARIKTSLGTSNQLFMAERLFTEDEGSSDEDLF